MDPGFFLFFGTPEGSQNFWTVLIGKKRHLCLSSVGPPRGPKILGVWAPPVPPPPPHLKICRYGANECFHTHVHLSRDLEAAYLPYIIRSVFFRLRSSRSGRAPRRTPPARAPGRIGPSSRPELCLAAGTTPGVLKQSSVPDAGPSRRHQRVVQLCGCVPYLEWFSVADSSSQNFLFYGF